MNTNTDMHADPHEFRENMKKWRKIRGMSQDDLARKITENPPDSLTFRQQTIQKIENGHRGLSLTDAVLISVALDVDLNTMLMGPDSPDMTIDEQVKDELRRDMELAHLALKTVKGTLEHLQKVYDIAPTDKHRESVLRQIATGERRDDGDWPEEEREAMQKKLDEELSKHSGDDNGVDN